MSDISLNSGLGPRTAPESMARLAQTIVPPALFLAAIVLLWAIGSAVGVVPELLARGPIADGSMVDLAQALPVGRFITVFPLDFVGPSVVQNHTVNNLKKMDVPIERMKDGDSFTLGGADIRVMKTNQSKVNGASAMLHIRYGGTSYLLAADVNRVAQSRLNRLYGDQLKADVIKYPHHAQEKLDEGFTRTVNPGFALITHGSHNTQEGQKWLDRFGIPFQFASWGLISLYSDGESIFISQELDDTSRGIKERWEQKR